MSDGSESWTAQEPAAPTTPAADNASAEPAPHMQPQAFVTDESLRFIVPKPFVTEVVAKDTSETPQPQPQPLPTEISERGQKGK